MYNDINKKILKLQLISLIFRILASRFKKVAFKFFLINIIVYSFKKTLRNKKLRGKINTLIFRYKDRREKNRKKYIPSRKQGMDRKSREKG